MQDLEVKIIQSDLIPENSIKNIQNFNDKISHIKSNTDLIILPEVFNTGFPADPEKFAEKFSGETVS